MPKLRGFRDYYPQDQAIISYLRDKVSSICRSFGYEEFEGPAVESMALYAAKSNDEIVREQAFSFNDRGGEAVVLRPELTPTLARMVAAKQNTLAMPIRWWSWGRFWRYERPQKGRSREFYQWNLDLIGLDSPQADAEIITILVHFLESLGLTSRDVVFELSDRAFVAGWLISEGVPPDAVSCVFAYLDKCAKLDDAQTAALAQKLVLNPKAVTAANRLASEPTLAQESPRLQAVLDQLRLNGVGDWAEPNLAVVRGFTYYTGIVFECGDRAKQFRSILGGGRYANLVADVGGQPVSGVGMGMGDLVLTELLTAKGLLPSLAPDLVVVAASQADVYANEIADQLRQAGRSVIVAYGELSKSLAFTNRQKARWAVIIGPDEMTQKTATVKNLATGRQQTVAKTELIKAIRPQPARQA